MVGFAEIFSFRNLSTVGKKIQKRGQSRVTMTIQRRDTKNHSRFALWPLDVISKVLVPRPSFVRKASNVNGYLDLFELTGNANKKSL